MGRILHSHKLGGAMEDVAIARIVYERALQEGVGLEVPLTED